MAESSETLGELAAVPCETCRITSTRFRVRPCGLCYAAERDDVSITVLPGVGKCEHCGTHIKRIVRVRWRGSVMVVGTTCAQNLIAEGAVPFNPGRST